MALGFNEQKGKAQKSEKNAYKYVEGDNVVRIVGDILPRYVYWIKGTNNKNIPMECLAFNREKEEFDNQEKDWVQEYFPDLKCSWSYATQCIDPTDGTVKVLNLKKKLWQQILVAAKELGDPTDVTSGWDICFNKEITGSHAFNVEYTLQQLKCQKAARPLTAEELELVADLRSMDLVLPRPTPAAQKSLLDELRGSNATNDTESINEEFAET